MNINPTHDLTTRKKLEFFSSPPSRDEVPSTTAPVDSLTLTSNKAKAKPTKEGPSLGASLISLGLSVVGVLGATTPAQAETVQMDTTSMRDLIEVTLQDLRASKEQTLSNPRFQDHDILSKLSADAPLPKGEEGPHIEAIQQALLDMGFAIEAGPTGGLYNQSINALNNFRASVQMEPRQDLDLDTLKKLDELAPPPGRTLSEHPTASFPQAQFINGKPVRLLVKIKEHRLFYYGADGTPESVYPVATGKLSKPTDPGLKVVNYKYDDPSRVAMQLWPESGGRAFGTKMIDLKWYDAETGETTSTDEEIHGTFSRRSIGTNASSGCVRLYNEDVEAIYPLVKHGDLVLFQE